MWKENIYMVWGVIILTEVAKLVNGTGTLSPSPAPSPAPTHENSHAHVGVWVVMGFYLLFLIAVAVWCYLRGRKLEEQYAAGVLRRTTSKLEDHYVGGRDLGPWSLALTLLASTWSGYTVVGAPQDTYRRGWNATRYMGGFVITQSTMLLLACRMQWYAFKRRYIGTVDFVTDRFRSHFARIFVSFVQLFASVLYVMGQFKSIGATVEGMSDGAIPALAASITLCIIMLAYEFMGGMKAIALTDLVQGLVLIVGCVCYFPLMEVVFEGGIGQTTRDLRTCAEAWTEHGAGFDIDTTTDLTFADYGCVMSGAADGSRVEYGAKDAVDLLTINQEDVEAWLPFYIAGISFPVYPQILVRFFTARQVNHLQYGLQLTHLSVFYLCLPAFLTGYTILSRDLPGLDRRDENTAQAFARIMNAAMDYNWFFLITGIFTVNAAIAAYMSTADSALMAASSAVTMEYLPYFYQRPPRDQEKAIERYENNLYFFAKGTSIFFGALAVWATKWNIALTDLYVVQGGILMLGCPAYFFGMYSEKVTALAINAGIVVSLPMYFIMFFEKMDLPEFWASVANIAIVCVFSYTPLFSKFANRMYYGKEDPWDPDEVPDFLTFADPLPRAAVGFDIRNGGGPMLEPIRPVWTNFIVYLLLFLAIPFWQNIPSSFEEQSFSGAMPTWAVFSTFLAAIAMLMNMFQTYYNWEDWITEEKKWLGDDDEYDRHKVYYRFKNGQMVDNNRTSLVQALGGEATRLGGGDVQMESI